MKPFLCLSLFADYFLHAADAGTGRENAGPAPAPAGADFQ